MSTILVPEGSKITSDKTYFTIPEGNNQTVVFTCGGRSVEFRWRDVFEILYSIAQRRGQHLAGEDE